MVLRVVCNALMAMLLIWATQIPAAAAGRVHDDDGDAPTDEESGAEEEAAAPSGGQGRTLGHRCELGCYCCGRTRASRFHRWRNSSLAPILEKTKPKRPESEQICHACLEQMRAFSKDVGRHEVRPSIRCAYWTCIFFFSLHCAVQILS
jgi:hypothetical protein